MAKQDIIVIGASAGGVSTLIELVKTLPENFPASIFVVMHVPPYSPSKLPQILSKAGRLEAVHPEDKEKLAQGKIYIAPPDHHMLLEDDHVMIRKGPQENRFRPSIDALFRSAAYVHGARVTAVILSGALDDGTSGSWMIKRKGGRVIVQDPEEATFPEMPRNVMEYVETDYTLRVTEMGAVLNRLIRADEPELEKFPEEEEERLALEVTIATKDNAFERGIMNMGKMAPFTCPDCHGALVSLKEGNRVRYRCHTGHAFTASTLLSGLTESVEETLWQAMRGLEETTMLLQHIGEHIMDAGDHEVAGTFFKKANETAERARIVHDSVFEQDHLSRDLQYKEKKKGYG